MSTRPPLPRSFPAWLRSPRALAALLGVVGLAITLVWLAQPTAPPLPGVRARTAVPILRPADLPGADLADLAFDAAGRLLLTDRRQRVILRLSPGESTPTTWGPTLSPDVTLQEPAGIAVAADEIYVVDRGEDRVVRLDDAGRVLGVLPLKPYGPYGPNGVAVGADGSLFVADTGRSRILQLAPDGRLVREIGRTASPAGQLKQPMALDFGPAGTLFVADWENERVYRWDAMLQPLDAWPTGMRPYGLAVDSLGRVYVPWPDQRRIQVFGPEGVAIGDLGGPGSAPIALDGPRRAAFAPDGSLHVLASTGVVRLLLEDTPPPAGRGSRSPVDLSTLAGLLYVALVILLVGDRRRRRAHSSAPVPPTATGALDRTTGER